MSLRLSAILAALLWCGPAIAGSVPTGVDLDIPNIRQDTPNWCWIATAKQVIRWAVPEFDLAQCRMLEIAKNAKPGECCDHPERCQQDGTLAGIGHLIELFTGTQAKPAPFFDVDRMHRLLQGGRPVVLALRNGPEQGHAVVLRGIEYMQTMRDAVPILLVNDPFSDHPDRTERIPYELLQPHLAGGVVPDVGPDVGSDLGSDLGR